MHASCRGSIIGTRQFYKKVQTPECYYSKLQNDTCLASFNGLILQNDHVLAVPPTNRLCNPNEHPASRDRKFERRIYALFHFTSQSVLCLSCRRRITTCQIISAKDGRGEYNRRKTLPGCPSSATSIQHGKQEKGRGWMLFC